MIKNFLAPPPPEAMKALTRALYAIMRVCPVPGAHKKDQPFAVRDLSRLLTQERSDMQSRPYWASPRNTSAYVYYFLPWNLYRLSWLLPGLDLNLKADDMVLDLGSGPLTMILALYLFRPDLRRVPLNVVCVDVARQPMELGRKILAELTAEEKLPWKISLIRAPLFEALRKLRGKAALVTAANVLNELPARNDSALENRMARLVAEVAPRMPENGRALMVEPGTRLGGRLIAIARKIALEAGFTALGPCPHNGPCPALEQWRYNPKGPDYLGWCHFVLPARYAPQGLAELTARARLDKESLSLSAVFLARPSDAALAHDLEGVDELQDVDEPDFDSDMDTEEGSGGFDYEEFEEDEGPEARREARRRAAPYVPANLGAMADLRVISDGISLPDEQELARYVCCAKGLGLLLNAGRVPSGGGTNVPWPKNDIRDKKTGALIFQRQ